MAKWTERQQDALQRVRSAVGKVSKAEHGQQWLPEQQSAPVAFVRDRCFRSALPLSAATTIRDGSRARVATILLGLAPQGRGEFPAVLRSVTLAHT